MLVVAASQADNAACSSTLGQAYLACVQATRAFPWMRAGYWHICSSAAW
jgi:hypothetical protein